MEAFNLLYPWIVVITGSVASTATIIGSAATAHAIIRTRARPDDLPALTAGATAVFALGSLAAIVELAIVHWILS
jgi:hypothetical protein